MMLVTSVSVCTFASDIYAIPNANVQPANVTETVASEDELSDDYVEVKFERDENAFDVNKNATSPYNDSLHLADDDSFFTDALEAMNEKIDRSRENTLKLRSAEKMRRETSNADWPTVTIKDDVTTGYVFEDKHKYIIDGTVSITNADAPDKDVITIPENALVHVEVANNQGFTIENKQTDKAAISLPKSAQLVVYGSHGDNSSINLAVKGKIIDRNADPDPKKSVVDSGTIYILGKTNFVADTNHTGLVYAHYLSLVSGCENATYGDLDLIEDGTVRHFDCEIVKDIATFRPEDKHFYYITKDFESNNAVLSHTAETGKSGITISENSVVFIGVAPNTTVNVTGGNASNDKPAGAGIEVPESSKLVLMGEGTINVTGGSSSVDNMGFGSGIGGRGGKSGNGQNCGEVYILENVTVNANHGDGPVSSVFPAFGIGGGGAGGTDYMDGINGEVYYDHEANKSNGRTRFYHESNISVNLNYDIEVRGNKDLILGDEYREEVTAEDVFNALGELYRRGGLKKGSDTWETVIYDDNYEINDHCNGAYRTNGSVWNKHFVDHTGGYLYLFSVAYGSYLSKNYKNEDDYPMAHINWMLNNSLKSIKDGDKYADSRKILSEILFQEHYQEPFGTWKDTAHYTRDVTTLDDYAEDDIDIALQYIGMTYITVLDDTSSRYCSMQYDTHRFPHDDTWHVFWWEYHYGYGLGGGSFKCLDGYKGVNGYNWMNFLPDNASLEQVNMPGTHDSGTFNIWANDEFKELIGDNLGKLWMENVPWWVNAILIGAHSLLITLPFALLADEIIAIFVIERDKLMDDGVRWIAQCQDLPIVDQLKAGGRVLDVRVAYAHENDEKETDSKKLLKIVHGTLDDLPDILGSEKPKYDVTIANGHDLGGNLLTFDAVLNDCQTFLADEKSRNESVVLILQTEGSKDLKDEKSSLNATLKDVYKFINEDGDNIYEIKPGDTIPSVGEAKGNIYIINGDDSNGIKTYDKVPAPSSWDVPAQKKIEYLKQIFEEAESIAQVYGEQKTLSGKDYQPKRAYASTYDISWEWDGFFKGLSIEDGLTGTPRKFAEIVNAYVENYVFTRGQYYGWIQFNFPTDTTNAKVYYSNVFDKNKLTKTPGEKRDVDCLHVYGLENKEYTGKAITQNVRITYEGVELKKGADYTLEYSNNTDAGVANVTIKCKGLYSGVGKATFIIEPKDINKLTIKDVNNVRVPDAGKTVNILTFIKDGSKTLSGNGNDYSVKYLNNEGTEVDLSDILAGRYKMVIEGNGNYAGTYENDFEVIAKDAVDMSTAVVTLDKKSITYGSDLPMVKQVKVGGKTYTISSTPSIADVFEINYQKDAENTGSHVISIKVKDGIIWGTGEKIVSGQTRVLYKVNCIRLQKQMFNIGGTYFYEGKPVEPSISSNLIKLNDYKIVSIKGRNTGNHTVTLKGIGNYTGTTQLKYSVGKCDLSKTSISVNSTAVYDKKGAKPDIKISINDVTLKQGTDYSVIYKNNRALGTATAIITGKGDYVGSYTGTYTVIKAPLDSSMINVNDVVYVKNRSQYKPGVIVKQGTSGLQLRKDYTLSYEGDGIVTEKDMENGYKEVTVTIKAVESGMYEGEATKKFTVYLRDRVASSLDGTVADKYYTGVPVTISANEIVLKDKEGKTLNIASSDISVISCKNNVKVGKNATVTFKVKGFGGPKTLKFKILPKSIK